MALNLKTLEASLQRSDSFTFRCSRYLFNSRIDSLDSIRRHKGPVNSLSIIPSALTSAQNTLFDRSSETAFQSGSTVIFDGDPLFYISLYPRLFYRLFLVCLHNQSLTKPQASLLTCQIAHTELCDL